MLTASFLIFKLWLSPTLNDDAQAGLKTTLQVGSNLWLKVRIHETQSDISRLDFSPTQPKVRIWAETDF